MCSVCFVLSNKWIFVYIQKRNANYVRFMEWLQINIQP